MEYQLSMARDDAATSVLAQAARGLTPSDVLFDALLAPNAQAASRRHWTPSAIGEIALRWLTAGGATRVLDVGAGVGKLCIQGALMNPRVRFVGIEGLPERVEEGRRIVARLGLSERVELRDEPLDTIDPHEFDAFYLYNPFAEHLALPPVDDEDGFRSEPGRPRFERDVRTVEGWLRDVKVGTRFVTLHGFGGWIPDSFTLVDSMPVGGDALRAWEKHREGGSLRTAYAERR